MSRCHADDAALPDPPQTDETKTQLLRVAERLFAQRGTAGVSLREIAREAGQRNTGAVHYHFGSREGVIEAIFALRAAEIDRERSRMLAAIPAEASMQARVRAVIRAIVFPFALLPVSTDGRNHYARFVAQVIHSGDEAAHRIWRARFSRSIERAYRLLAETLPDQPVELTQHRFAMMFRLAVHGTADLCMREPSEPRSDRRRSKTDDRSRPDDTQGMLELENLVDMLAAAVLASPGEAVATAAQAGQLEAPLAPGSLAGIFGQPGLTDPP